MIEQRSSVATYRKEWIRKTEGSVVEKVDESAEASEESTRVYAGRSTFTKTQN